MSVVVFLFRNIILEFFGDSYNVSSEVFFWMTLSVPLFALINVFNQGLIASSQFWSNASIQIVWNFVFVVGVYLLVSKGGSIDMYFQFVFITVFLLLIGKYWFNFRTHK